MKPVSVVAAALALACAACQDAGSGGQAAPDAAETTRQLAWSDLMPAGESEVLEKLMREHMERAATIREGSAADEMVQVGTFNVVESLDGVRVRMPGFVIPFSFNKENAYSEFLLVPYAGACIHSPPPPPNQIVYVRADAPVTVESIWDPVWVEGELRTQAHEDELGDAAYTLRLDQLEAYQS